ncbi:DUF397 domain-containing protein [Spirillospora sp. NPDC029432]|uniref:DUF397 domain-containing protein n=1 Tax=Spirillospora sp. NPDC029432 TaxID=3154599 RepID=UPI003451ED18
MTTPAIWRKSSFSSGSSGQSDCVELARLAGRVGVRDSKAPDQGALTLTLDNFADLLARVKRANSHA